MPLLVGSDNLDTASDSELEKQAEDASAQAQAVNALDRAEETFSNSEPGGDSESESDLSILSNEPEVDNDYSSDSEDPADELPLAAKPGPKAEFTLANGCCSERAGRERGGR